MVGQSLGATTDKGLQNVPQHYSQVKEKGKDGSSRERREGGKQDTKKQNKKWCLV